MKKLKTLVLILLLIQPCLNRINAQESKHVFGFGIGRVAYNDDIVYANTSVGDYWFKYNQDIILNFNYAYKVFPYFRIGGYFEYEKAKMESNTLGEVEGSRFDLGLHYLAEYPGDSKLRLQLGGYFAFSVLSNELWDESIKGLSYGIMGGPCLYAGKFSIALHVHAGMSPYFGDEPENVDILAPKVLLKFYYNL